MLQRVNVCAGGGTEKQETMLLNWMIAQCFELMLKLQYFGHLMRKTDWGKTLMLGKIEGRRRERQRTRWLDGIMTRWTWVWASSRSWRWAGKPGMLQSMGSQRVGHDWAERLNWTVCGSSSWVMTEFCSQFSLLGSLQNLFS